MAPPLVVTSLRALLVVAAAGCGSRTGLVDREGPADAAARDAAPDGGATCEQPRESVDAPLVVARGRVQWFGNLAWSGCAFAATWIANDAGRTQVVVAVGRVAGGRWQVSPVRTVGPADLAGLIAHVAWDGEAFRVFWSDARRVFYRRLDADGAPVGDAVATFDVGPNPYVRWVAPATDGLRVGIQGGTGYFGHLARDGRVTAAPTAVVDATASTLQDLAGFARADGANLLAWTRRTPEPASELLLTTFDDAGASLGAPVLLGRARTLQTSRRGVVVGRGGRVYVGVLDVGQGARVFVRDGMETRSIAVDGGDRPVLALDAAGQVGALAASSSATSETPLRFTLVRDGATLPAAARAFGASTAYNYDLVAAGRGFLALWNQSDEIRLAAVTP